MIQFIKLLSRLLLLLVLAFIVQPVVYCLLIVIESSKAFYALYKDADYRARIQWPTVKEFREFFNF